MLNPLIVNSAKLKNEFINFLKNLYKPSINREIYINKIKETFNFKNFNHFIIKENNKIVAVFSTGSNKLLTDENNNIFGLIGFLESVNNFEVFRYLLL